MCFVIGNEHGYLLKPASTWRNEPAELSPVERLMQLNSLEVNVLHVFERI